MCNVSTATTESGMHVSTECGIAVVNQKHIVNKEKRVSKFQSLSFLHGGHYRNLFDHVLVCYDYQGRSF